MQSHRRLLWALAAGTLGRPDEIEDVLQEAAMIGLERIGQFDRGTCFAAWMGRIVRFVALNRGRLRQRRQTDAADPATIDAAFAAPAAARTVEHAVAVPKSGGFSPIDEGSDMNYLALEVDDELFAALGRLRPKVRACLMLRALAELDYETIGSVLGLRAGTAMSHVHRARQELQRLLAPIAGVEQNSVHRDGRVAP